MTLEYAVREASYITFEKNFFSKPRLGAEQLGKVVRRLFPQDAVHVRQVRLEL